MSESRKEREDRLTLEYQAYVDACKSDGQEPINFMNWSFNEKVAAKADAEDHDWLSATIGHAAPVEIEKAAARKVEREAKKKADEDAAAKANSEAAAHGKSIS